MSYSTHASIRAQQRCIPPIVLEWLTEYGDETHDGHGAIKIYFSHKSIRAMERKLGRRFVRENKKYLKAYRVDSLKDGRTITCGWLTKSVKH